MKESNINRIRNILSGEFTAKSSISIGYEKETDNHKDGDIWEDSNGKKFIKKNGLVRSYSKLSSIRNTTKMPLICPVCGSPMTIWQDHHMWKKFRKCFSCVINEDTQRIINGEQEQYEKNKIKQNSKAWLNDLEIACLEAVESIDSKAFVTEMGDIEDWDAGHLDKNKLKESIKEHISELKEKLDI